MSNPLVAQPKDSTTAVSGISILEDAQSLKTGIESGDWASTVMGVAGTAMDALSVVADPFGAILANGVGWLIEHVGPLKEALDKLAGNPDQITAASETWKNIADELTSVSSDMIDLVNSDLQSWAGSAADAYRKQADEVSKLLQGASQASEGASSGVKTAGEVVAAVRMLVRDTIAQVVGHMVSWALQVIFTLGVGLSWVVPQVVNLVAKTAKDLAELVKNLVKALGDLGKLLTKAGHLFQDAAGSLKNLKPGKISKGAEPGGLPKGPGKDTPKPAPGGDSTTTSSAGYHGSDTPPAKDTPPAGKGGDDTTTTSSAPKLDDGGPPPPAKSSPGGDSPSGSDGATGGDIPAPKPKDTPDTSGSTTPSSNKPGNPRDRSVGTDDRVCKSDPVDVATGEVVIEQLDLDLGTLLFERTHVSSYRAGRWFGPSWASSIDQRLEVDDEHVCYFAPDGKILVYALGDGTRWPLEGPRWPLTRTERGYSLHAGDRDLEFPGTGHRLALRAITSKQHRVEVFYNDLGAPALLRRDDGVRVAVRTENNRVTELAVLGDGTLADVRVLRFGYDERRRLTEVVNSSGRPQLFDYDLAGRVTGWQDRNGVRYRYVYDERGRCVRTEGVDGFLNGAFDYGDHLTRHTDSLGHTTEFRLNDAHQVVSETDPLGDVTHFEWDRYDRLLARTDSLGRATRYTYDGDGVLATITRPDGSVARPEHDESGQVVAITVDDGERTFYRRYDNGAPDPLTEQVGIASAISLDQAPPANPDAVETDQFGRPREVPEAGGGRVRLGWTVEGLRAARSTERRERELWRYDGEGNEIEHTDELGRRTRREYGPFDKLTAVTDPSGARTTYGYDTELRLTSVTDPLGRTWHYRYDALGRLVHQTDFGGRTRTYVYGSAGHLMLSTDPAGEPTEYRYDALGNLVEVRAPERTTTYHYDPVGMLVHADNGESAVEFERDEFGRVVRETVNGRSVEFAYSPGTIRRRTPGGLESTWTFDDLDRPIRLATGSHVVEYRYDADGRVTARTADGVSKLSQSYGPGGALTSQTVTAGPATVQRRGFTYQPGGSLARLRDDVTGATTLARDPAGRIIAVTTARGREEYRYDSAGTPVPPPGAAVAEDEHGRRVRRQAGQTFSWSGDRLAAVTTGDGTVWHYHYDPLGRRIGKTSRHPDGTTHTTHYTWDGTTLIEESRPDGIVTWDHLPGTPAPVAQSEHGARGEVFHTFVTDSIGTPTDLLDDRGALAWTSRRTLTGRELTAAATPLRFPGQYADAETGLHYNVFRYYDPATARYLSQDPLGLEPGPDPYAYVTDPFAEFDALGLMNCSTKASSANPAPATPNAGHNAGNTGGSTAKPTPPPLKNRPPAPIDPLTGKPKLPAKPSGLQSKPTPAPKPPELQGKPTPAPKPAGLQGNPKPDAAKPDSDSTTASTAKPDSSTPDTSAPKPEPAPKPDPAGTGSHPDPKPEPATTKPDTDTNPAPHGGVGTNTNPGSKPPAARTDFHPAPEGTKFGVKRVEGTYTFTPEPQKIGGTRFNGVAGQQEHVFQGVIDDKIAQWKKDGQMDTPTQVPVYYPPNKPGQLTIDGDKHHTFAAAMQSGRPIELVLRKQPGGFGAASNSVDWTGTTTVPGRPTPGKWVK
ncbi:RHS repeat-associated core domain-containing protein [Amycolatopsis sp. NPDC005232]|uniref:RHS repeat-associated core domain-containing protein n=1 Tax=Amycolatopsis sp. NPDC005232 TaxID=3157027 RepID=UPI0033AA76F5